MKLPSGWWRGCAAAALSVAALTATCVATQAKADEPPKVQSVRLVPENRTLWGAKAAQHLLVLATFGDGLERDVTSESKFTMSDSKVAKLGDSGVLTAVSDGHAVLTASFRGQAAKTDVRVTGSNEKRPFSFGQDIGAILTKNGCNDSLCHGGVKGKGGFKLSQNALYARDDYKWIVQGGTYHVLTTDEGTKVPRINLKEPEKSLLLLKPTMSVAHGGGLRFATGSADYETILTWVRQGAPYGEEGKGGSVEVERVEVTPREVVLAPQGKHHLLVTAYLSNGRQEDLTGQVRYASNNSEVVKVSSDGAIVSPRESFWWK